MCESKILPHRVNNLRIIVAKWLIAEFSLKKDKIQPSFDSDAGAVTCKGPGIERPLLGKQNSFSVDCSQAGNNVLFVGIYGPEKPK